MKQVTYEETIGKDIMCIITGEEVDNLKCTDKRNEFRLQMIKEKVPMNFKKINTVIHRELDPIAYIKFWSKIKIYKVVEQCCFGEGYGYFVRY